MNIRYNLFTAVFLLISSFSVAQSSFKVNFKKFQHEPIENIATFNPQKVEQNEIVSNNFYRFIQFNHVLSKDEINQLQIKGIDLLSYVSNYTYLASISKDFSKSDLKNTNIRSIWEIQKNLKVAEDVQNRSLPSWAIQGDKALLLVKYFKNLKQETVKSLLIDQKIEVLEFNGINNFLKIALPLDDLEDLSELPYLESIEPILPPDIKDDRRGRSLHRVNKLDPNYAGARNYTGKDINILIRDDGAVFEHIDFQGRLDQTFAGESIGSHGDGVAGIAGGAGNLNPIYKGMAHDSKVHVINYRANFLDETLELFVNEDVIVTNSSYSNGCNVGYTNTTQIVDQQTFDNPTLMHVFSAGNNGEGERVNGVNVSCGYGASSEWGNITGGHKQGKNVIATANVNYKGEIMTSSSRGPAHDGRIKPDIAANGNNHISTAEEQGYFSFGGTSGAAPVVTGVMAILHEAFEVNQGRRANAALLKALMLNTANDLGNKGPDFIYGWGSLNAYRAALSIEESRFLNGEIAQGEKKSHTITVPENVAEVKIMTYWPDPEASTFSLVSLINDLNTSLKSSNGTTYLPWVLDHTPTSQALSTPATKGIDFLNNMEQVAIDNPEAGEYTLEIDGFQIPFGSKEYYVVWEFRMNEIDIIFPDGGENLNYTSSEVIHWDATGDEGNFAITHIDSEGNVFPVGLTGGSQRYFEWSTPNNFSEKSRIRVSRGDLSDESTETFLLANNPSDLNLKKGDDNDDLWLHWDSDTIPVSYNIYALGEFKMEKMATVEADSFLIPDDPIFNGGWAAVSANYADGSEGKRSVAITVLPPPSSLGINNKNDRPCIFKEVIFESLSTDTLLEFNWNFGSNSTPSMASTRGPHSVVYDKKGLRAASLIVTNRGGTDQTYFLIDVQGDLEQNETEIIIEGEGQYTFTSNITGADSYTWDFGDGNTGTGQTVSHTFTASDIYTVTLEAENACGIVTEIDQVDIKLTSINELKDTDFTISPNPNHGDFEIILPDLEGEGLDIQLFSIDGKMVDSKRFDSTEAAQKISWNSVQSGLYFLRFKIGNQELTRKLIVE